MKNYIIYLPDFKTSVEWASHAQRTALSVGWEMYLFEGINGNTVANYAGWSRWNVKINQSDKAIILISSSVVFVKFYDRNKTEVYSPNVYNFNLEGVYQAVVECIKLINNENN